MEYQKLLQKNQELKEETERWEAQLSNYKNQQLALNQEHKRIYGELQTQIKQLTQRMDQLEDTEGGTDPVSILLGRKGNNSSTSLEQRLSTNSANI